MTFDGLGEVRHPLRVAVLVKQVPAFEELSLGSDGRLRREGLQLEMNPYCRRAVSKGTELARWSGGRCVVFTMGPPSAEDCLREAIAWGADEGVLISDPRFAGSDTLATARALSAALRREGGFDLVLMGRNSVDADTGQVGPQIAELLGLPFLTGAKSIETDGRGLRAWCELDDGWRDAELTLPAVVSCAERLCEPCKAGQSERDDVAPDRIRIVDADALGPGPWGQDGSPTWVGEVRSLAVTRDGRMVEGPVKDQAQVIVDQLLDRGPLRRDDAEGRTPGADVVPGGVAAAGVIGGSVAVIVEPGRPGETRDLLGAAAVLASSLGTIVDALVPGSISEVDTISSWGADRLVLIERLLIEEDVAHGIGEWCLRHHPAVLLATGTSWGREVSGRLAARLGAGLTGDAVDLTIDDGRLVSWKPAFGGQVVAAVRADSPVQMVTVRPGVLPRRRPRPPVTDIALEALLGDRHSRITVRGQGRDDDLEALASSPAIIGVGAGVQSADYPLIEPLRLALGAELGATRKVTDKGWMPHARQIGITGRSVSPELYIALGLSGKFNHSVGFRGAGLVVAVNSDPEAPIFKVCDLGAVADWRQLVPHMVEALNRRSGRPLATVVIPDN
jgi:electron transfer flavoprotein alpha subunit